MALNVMLADLPALWVNYWWHVSNSLLKDMLTSLSLNPNSCILTGIKHVAVNVS